MAVHACGLAPADRALCRGLHRDERPRGVGIDVSGTVEAVGDGVTDVRAGDVVPGTADWRGTSSAGASQHAIMDRWTVVPEDLDFVRAAALPMAVDTACRHLSLLGTEPGRTMLIHGGGTTIGHAAGQIALLRGMRVIATAGETHAGRLHAFGAKVTAYGGRHGRAGRDPQRRNRPTSPATRRRSAAPRRISSGPSATTRKASHLRRLGRVGGRGAGSPHLLHRGPQRPHGRRARRVRPARGRGPLRHPGRGHRPPSRTRRPPARSAGATGHGASSCCCPDTPTPRLRTAPRVQAPRAPRAPRRRPCSRCSSR
ncbi:alcohol dehydrogenase catalytic domain-containing protein [Streptomyces thermoviolaceus]|nr:alcohol dehydrogenase catalytic domain-containing protein [Streptomyces thermoviolaceus]